METSKCPYRTQRKKLPLEPSRTNAQLWRYIRKQDYARTDGRTDARRHGQTRLNISGRKARIEKLSSTTPHNSTTRNSMEEELEL